MAKQPSGKGGMAKVRFIMLDAEIPEGDLSSITEAIQNALKPTHIIQQRIPMGRSAPAVLEAPKNGTAELEDVIDADEGFEDVQSPASKKPREPRNRRVISPNVVRDLDLNGEVPWVEFAAQKSPKTQLDKFLVAAEWLNRYRSLEEVSADHIFTCFKRVGWSTNIGDFGAPLRALKGRGDMSSGTQKSFYAINHLGTSRVDEMGA